jgi:hypothetical protein
MSSFVDVMANDVWSEQDIVNRTEAMIRSEFSDAEQVILNRKVAGVAFGFAMSESEQAQLLRFQALCLEAQAAGAVARTAMGLLQGAMDVEAATARLALPAVTVPETVFVIDEEGQAVEVPNPAIEADAVERAAAQAVIDGADLDVLDLVEMRHAARLQSIEMPPPPDEGVYHPFPEVVPNDDPVGEVLTE